MVLPSLARFLRIFITYVAVCESRPDVGSSKKIKLGLVINSTPIEVLFLSPPEIPFTNSPPIFVP